MGAQVRSVNSLAEDFKRNTISQEQIESLYGSDVFNRIMEHLKMEAVEYPLQLAA